MPGNLPEGIVIVLEEVAHLGPLVEQPADPGPGDQANPGFDTACPVDARQERVRTPPGAQLRRGRLCITLVLRQPPGGRQNGDLMVPRHLPNLLDVAGLRLVPMVDAERQLSVGRSAPCHRIVKPVRVGAVGTRCTEHQSTFRPEPPRQPGSRPMRRPDRRQRGPTLGAAIRRPALLGSPGGNATGSPGWT